MTRAQAMQQAKQQAERAVSPHSGRGAFAAQFEASWHVLWLVAVGIVRDRTLAEDVVQEAAFIALGKLDEFQSGTNFRAWMAQIIRNVAANQIRKDIRRRTATWNPADLDLAGGGRSTASTLTESELTERGQLPADQQQFDDRVMQALSAVPEAARACLLLRTLRNLEYSEIAELLGIPEGTAMSHVHRTRKRLREVLADMRPREPGGEGEPS